jgi:hypothetical protein
MSADAIIARGREAWGRLQASRNWEDWLDVGHALMEGRSWAMPEARVNQSVGRAYNDKMGQWLREYGFHEIDKATRSQTLTCMEHEAEIKAWRATLSPAACATLNNPMYVLRRWRQASKANPNANKSSPMTEAKAEIARLKLEIKQLKDRRGNSFTPADTPEAIAEVVAADMIGASANKLEETATAIAHRLRVEAHKRRVREDKDKQRAGPKKAGGHDRAAP